MHTLRPASYLNISDLWAATLTELLTSSADNSRAGPVHRMQGFCARILHPQNNILLNPIRRFSLRYGCGELCWYLNPNASMDQITHYAPSYTRFAEDNYAFYGPRLHGQILKVSQMLRSDPSDRRGVVSIWTVKDLAKTGRKDLPCTISWKFNVCDGMLNMIADMRSNDSWLGMPNDIFVNTCVHVLMCKLTGYDIGFYQHQVADMHLYQKDKEKAIAALDHVSTYQSTPMGQECFWTDVQNLLLYEEKLRLDKNTTFVITDPFFNFVCGGLNDYH